MAKYQDKDIEHLLMNSKSDSPLVELAQQVGLQEMKKIMGILAGSMGCEMYIPSFDNFVASITRARRDEDIVSSFDGAAGSIKILAARHGLKKRRVQQIIAASGAWVKA